MSLWRVWYTNGALDYGWLASEHGNGRMGIFESSEEHAKAQADAENEAAPLVVHRAFPNDMPREKLDTECEQMRLEARQRQRARWA
jgi:hypothetical protein